MTKAFFQFEKKTMFDFYLQQHQQTYRQITRYISIFNEKVEKEKKTI